MTNRVFFKIYSQIYCTDASTPCKIPKDFDMWSLIFEKDDPNFNPEEYANRPKDSSPDFSTSPDASTDPTKTTGGAGRRL